MSKRLEVSTAKRNEDQLIFFVPADEEVVFTGLNPGERMLVDSEKFSFIYILETEDELVYLSIPEKIWPDMKAATDENIPVTLMEDKSGNSMELININKEMTYLIQNIKGNSNYGDEMMERVEKSFY